MTNPQSLKKKTVVPSALNRVCSLYEMEVVAYQQAWDLQRTLAAQIGNGDRPPALLLLEHPHTFTFGRRGEEQHLLWSPEVLERQGVQVHWVDRGGDVTYHGPGQLVGYPLLPLGVVDSDGRLPNPDYVGYLRRLEELLIAVLDDFGIQADRTEGLTGVWVDRAGAGQPAKIAAIGVKVDVHGVSTHGFALNVDPDMTYWQGIIPCGLDQHPLTCMRDLLGAEITVAQVRARTVERFAELFGFRMEAKSDFATRTRTA